MLIWFYSYNHACSITIFPQMLFILNVHVLVNKGLYERIVYFLSSFE